MSFLAKLCADLIQRLIESLVEYGIIPAVKAAKAIAQIKKKKKKAEAAAEAIKNEDEITTDLFDNMP